MSSFYYKALGSDSRVVESVLQAASRQDAIAKLGVEGLTLLQLRECGDEGAVAAVMGNPRFTGRLPAKVREAFIRQLSALLAAGVPLATALRRLAAEAHHHGAALVWQAVHDLVADGAALADAMAQFPKVFPRVTTAMVRAGETGGFLDVVLEQIGDFESRDRDLRGKLLTALVYPIVLAALSVAVVAFLMTFFIPRFEGLFSDFGAALPPLTRMIVAASRFLRDWGLVALLVAAAAGLGLQQWFRSESGRRHRETWLLRLPIVGALTARFALTRFCRMLGTLVGSGVPLVTGLNVAGESLGNQVLMDAVKQAVQRVRRGGRLADSLAECTALFPGSVVEIISVAEQASRLDKELLRLAESTEKELDRQLHMAVALIEPAMLFVMAGVIGTIVVGMVLPIFALQDYIK